MSFAIESTESFFGESSIENCSSSVKMWKSWDLICILDSYRSVSNQKFMSLGVLATVSQGLKPLVK